MIELIISGGQTGADRAGLDFAIANGITHGGYCNRGRKAEDGEIPDKYNLVQIDSMWYKDRTARNIKESDATLIFCSKNGSRGSDLTQDYCNDFHKPYLVIHVDKLCDSLEEEAKEFENVVNFIKKVDPTVINIAGNRESVSPGIHEFVMSYLTLLFEELKIESTSNSIA